MAAHVKRATRDGARSQPNIVTPPLTPTVVLTTNIGRTISSGASEVYGVTRTRVSIQSTG